MKTIKLLLVILTLAITRNSYAQGDSHLTLSATYPEAGKTTGLTYNTAGTKLDGKTAVYAKIYYIDNKNYPVDSVSLAPNGKLWNAEIVIPDSTRAFIVQVIGDTTLDNNGGKGYVYLINKGKKPVPGAYAAKGSILQMNKFFGLKEDNDAVNANFQKEYELHPVSGKSYKYYNYFSLARKPTAENVAIVNRVIDSLNNSATEYDRLAAIRLTQSLHKSKKADSLIAIGIAKYPDGDIARYQLENQYFDAKSVGARDTLYQLYSKNKYANAETSNYMVLVLTTSYLHDANFEKYNTYKHLLKDTSVLADYDNSLAWNWALAGQHLPEAEKISKESVDILTAKVNHPVSYRYQTADEVKRQAITDLNNVADTYALILYKEGKYAQALSVEAPVWANNSTDPDISKDYALILIANGNYDKATGIIESVIKSGKGSQELSDALKQCYVHKNGNDKGFDDYIAALNAISKKQAQAELVSQMIKEPAPLFTLKDLNGNTVSLASLKGKTVIVDFWATWCGPCKASMPGMQLAVNKYKDDPNVQFLFIDTWENGDDYQPGVKKFISDNKYSFNVLLDEKNESGAQAKVVSAYKVEGIPTKFIIDKNGDIRFKYVGYAGTPEALVAEVSNMIDLAK